MKTKKDVPVMTKEEGIQQFINTAKDAQINVLKADSNINSNIKSDIKSDININIKSNIKKPPKDEMNTFFTHLPKEYTLALSKLSVTSGYNKRELSEEAFQLLFKKHGVEFIK
jgi:hypothetical protein